MIEPPPPPEVDRRDFVSGRWTDGAKPATEIASILVQVRPQRLDAVAHTIDLLPGAQIYSRDPRGKLVVVVEATEVGAIGTSLNVISSMPDVLTAALVFHGTDDS